MPAGRRFFFVNAVKHFSFPGMNDMGIAILPHELGHYFSLLHINGIWMFNEEFPRELVSGEECGFRGDLICDTPGQPGYGGGESFFTEIYEGERICVYQGFKFPAINVVGCNSCNPKFRD